MQQFNINERDALIKCLKRKEQCLDDAHILNILYLLCDLRKPPDLLIVDPLVIASLRRTERHTKYLKELLLNPPHKILCFPLIYASHWSLLIFLPSLKGYIHFDSIERCHRAHLNFILSIIDEGQRYHTIPLSSQLPQQDADWECGYFLLMSAYMFIDMKLSTLENEETLRLYITKHIPSLCEANVSRFICKIQAILLDL